MIYLTNVASLGVIGFAAAGFVYPDARWLAPSMLALAVMMLVGSVATRLEEAPHEPNASRK